MFSTTLLGKDTIADGTMLFRFARPDDFTFKAGQHIDMTLINPPETDAEGNSRTFSLVSTPQDTELAVATRMRDTAFKRSLSAMPEQTEVSVDGPFGSFFLHENTKRPAVFLAGGIGITPFFSMIADATERELPHKLVLFYSNRRPEDAPFLAPLLDMAQANQNFTFIPTMTEMEKSQMEWTGERGVITKELVQAHVDMNAMPIFYLAGPGGMVSAMRLLLNSAGVSNDDIRTEEFSGY